MHKVYVRELKPYSLAALSSLFGYSFSQAKILVGDLMTHGIVRYRTGTKSIPEEDDAEDAAPDELYQFRFVGLVVWGDALIVAYPKYFRDRVPTDDELRLILRILKRGSSKNTQYFSTAKALRQWQTLRTAALPPITSYP